MRKASLFVVPVDFAPDMEATVESAFALARRNGARVHLLEVVPRPGPSLLDSGPGDEVGDRAKSASDWSRLERAISAAERRGVRVRTVVYRGDRIGVIASYLDLVNATLLIVSQHYGTSPRRRSARLVTDLSRTVLAPALILPPTSTAGKRRELSFRHIVSAADFTVASAVALRTVVDLIRRSGARLTLVHALRSAPSPMVLSGFEAMEVTRNFEAQAAQIAERLRSKVPDPLRIRADARVTTGAADRAILSVASEVQADLIVIGVPPRSRIDQALSGSTLRGVLRGTVIPVLVLTVPAGAHRWLEGIGAGQAEQAQERSIPGRRAGNR